MCSLDLFTIPCQVVLERELEGHLGDFGQNSADEILLPVKFGVFLTVQLFRKVCALGWLMCTQGFSILL